MAFSINEFRAKALPKGGARPTLFYVDIVFPFKTEFQDRTRFLCRAASVPMAPIDSIRVPYMGRSIKIAGDREFPDWTVRVMNDENFPLRVAFEKWSNLINALEGNRMDASVFQNMNYMTTATVYQLSKSGPDDPPIRSYILENLFPVNVDAMQLDWEAQNQLQEYDVTFAFSHWTPGQRTNSDDAGFDPSGGLNITA